MPLHCPKFTQDYNDFYSKYNACLDCNKRHDNECWAIPQASVKLADILTIEERIAILEDRRESPEVNIVTISRQDYQQLQRLILSLKEKLETHIGESSSLKRKGFKRYE